MSRRRMAEKKMLFLHLAPRAGRGRIRAIARIRVRGSHRAHFIIRICGSGPSPQPAKSELRSSRPREVRGEGAIPAFGYAAGTGNAVTDLIFSIAKREVTFFSGTAPISFL